MLQNNSNSNVSCLALKPANCQLQPLALRRLSAANRNKKLHKRLQEQEQANETTEREKSFFY